MKKEQKHKEAAHDKTRTHHRKLSETSTAADPGQKATTHTVENSCNSKHGCGGKVEVSDKTGNMVEDGKDTGIKPESSASVEDIGDDNLADSSLDVDDESEDDPID